MKEKPFNQSTDTGKTVNFKLGKTPQKRSKSNFVKIKIVKNNSSRSCSKCVAFYRIELLFVFRHGFF